MKGSWEASLLSSLSLPFGGSAAPSFQPLLFTQRPDLFLSFILFDKVFVEARITEDLSQARYAAGYRGGEGEVLSEARIGNDGISFPTMPFLSLGGGSYRSFGAKASAKTGRFDGAAMIRYDQADRVTKRFAGGASVEEKTFLATNYVSGRWFVTSGAPIAGLELFARSSGGSETGSDGNSYRKLDAGEYSFAAATGAIALGARSATRIIAAYDGAAAELTIAGRSCEILFDPAAEDGAADPRRQVLSRYAASASARSEAYVRDSSSGQRDPDFEVRIDPSGYLEVLREDGEDPLRPFEGLMPWIYLNDYAMAADREYAAAPTRDIVVREYGSSSGIVIDLDAIAGSVELRRNGSPEYAFSLDARMGAITLATPAGMTELIEVSYLRESAERRAGSIAAALGGNWVFDGGLAVWAGLGTRWAVPGVGYASGESSNPGTVVLTAGEKDAEGPLTHRAAVAASYGRDEATGRYRIDGMEGSSSSLASTFRPAALSTSDYSARESSEGKLVESFPSLVASTHPDGSAQRALRIEAGDAASGSFYKIEGTVPYASFVTFAFCARVDGGVSSQAALTLAIDNGSAAAVAVTLARGSIGEGWRRFYLRYGEGSASIVARESEEGPELVLGAAATASADLSVKTAARLHIIVAGLEKGATLWIDEVTLEESTGRAAIVFQGAVAYANQSLRLGPVLSGLTASADASAALREDAYATGGASLSTKLGFANLTARARGSVMAGASPHLRGGHDIAVPTFSFPATATESFDFDPATGAFGRDDKLSLKAEDALVIDAVQKTLWTPPSIPTEFGLLEQSWTFGLSAAKGTVTLAAGVSNAAKPELAIETPGDYGSAWKESFKYYIPALESESAKREALVSAALKAGALGEVAKASLRSIAE
ncbi:MAG: hypothetical protein Q8M76_15630, partial [Spirochaetaceae bacterium]|nr:hypothetical protein [Spirochaetaceae bacterium]